MFLSALPWNHWKQGFCVSRTLPFTSASFWVSASLHPVAEDFSSRNAVSFPRLLQGAKEEGGTSLLDPILKVLGKNFSWYNWSREPIIMAKRMIASGPSVQPSSWARGQCKIVSCYQNYMSNLGEEFPCFPQTILMGNIC